MYHEKPLTLTPYNVLKLMGAEFVRRRALMNPSSSNMRTNIMI